MKRTTRVRYPTASEDVKLITLIPERVTKIVAVFKGEKLTGCVKARINIGGCNSLTTLLEAGNPISFAYSPTREKGQSQWTYVDGVKANQRVLIPIDVQLEYIRREKLPYIEPIGQ